MRYPRFIAEMAAEVHRDRLRAGIVSGYATTAAFLALSGLAHVTHVVPFQPGFAAILVFKLATNTLAWLGLRRDRLVLETAGLNILGDMVSMTGCIYFTGGELSPLFPIYAIEITVLALLANVGITIMAAITAILCFAGMAVLVRSGVLPAFPPPVVTAGGVTSAYTAIDIVYAAVVIGIPTFYTARILQDLREKGHALEARTKALVDARQQKSQFMTNMTHELRTPIHGICGLTDLVESGVYGAVTPKQREAQQSIKSSARALLALIDDLLELARADAGKLALRPERVDLSELLPTVVASIKWMLGTKQLEVELDVAPELPVVKTDPRKLNQVVINLLSNAVKFTPEGGSIVVRARRGGQDGGQDAVHIEVQDSGIGIAKEDQARIFEEFRQLDGSPERPYGGVGLGLALVKRLTEALGAEVAVESGANRGATFTVKVPVAWRGVEGRGEPGGVSAGLRP
jgi:signal transduction histidine kinase